MIDERGIDPKTKIARNRFLSIQTRGIFIKYTRLLAHCSLLSKDGLIA